jgi:hypothetical protein
MTMAIRDVTPESPEQIEDLVLATLKVQFAGQRPDRDTAEEAVMAAYVVLLEKSQQFDDGPIGGLWRTIAERRVMNTLKTRAHIYFLETILAQLENPDNAELLIDPRNESGLAHVEAQCLLEEVRALHAHGLKPVEIMDELRIPRTTERERHNAQIRRRARERLASRPGKPKRHRWTREDIIDAVRQWAHENGRAPRETDAPGSPVLPSAKVVRDHFGRELPWLKLANVALAPPR